ncbi:hypothetical protein BGX31_007908 [Mortierella sp. GBA43]|nr:hypothetical protein BGX31_007908 [Mortierella sp. GBA43]
MNKVDHDDDFENLPRRIAQIAIREENILEERQEDEPDCHLPFKKHQMPAPALLSMQQKAIGPNRDLVGSHKLFRKLFILNSQRHMEASEDEALDPAPSVSLNA